MFFRKELADIANASRSTRTVQMDNFIKELFVKGFADTATEDEIEEFDTLLDEMESA